MHFSDCAAQLNKDLYQADAMFFQAPEMQEQPFAKIC